MANKSDIDERQVALVSEFEEFLGTTTKQTAEVLGVSYSTYMKWRTGTRSMGASAVRCMTLVRFIVRAGLELPDVSDDD